MAPKKSIMDRVKARLNKSKPKANASGQYPNGQYEIAEAEESHLSEIKYVLQSGNTVWDAVIGGLPFGRVVELFGMESCGKTAMAIRMSIMALKKEIYEVVRDKNDRDKVSYKKLAPKDYDITVLYIDNEQSLDGSSKTVIDGTELSPATAIISRVDTVELMFKEVDLTLQELALVEKEEKRAQFLVVVVDTIACTASKEEMSQDWGKDDYNRQPKQLRGGFRKMIRSLNRHNVCMICTNQVSHSFEKKIKKGGAPTSNTLDDLDFNSFGGKALQYASSYRIFMHKLDTKYTLVRRKAWPDGMVVRFKAVKNRLKHPAREGRAVLLYGEKTDGFHSVLSMFEQFLYMKYAEYDSNSQKYVFKFNRLGIETETFEAPAKGKKKDPRIEHRGEWVAFYKAHQKDFDKMWDRAIEEMFTHVDPDNFGEAVKKFSDSEIEDDEEEGPQVALKPRSRESLEKAADLVGDLDD